MASLKQRLLDRLAGIEGLTAEPSPVAGGTALVHRGREIAHFHHDHELDLRLTRALIAASGLSHPRDSVVHPKRAASSHWIELRLQDADDVERVAGWVEQAIGALTPAPAPDRRRAPRTASRR